MFQKVTATMNGVMTVDGFTGPKVKFYIKTKSSYTNWTYELQVGSVIKAEGTASGNTVTLDIGFNNFETEYTAYLTVNSGNQGRMLIITFTTGSSPNNTGGKEYSYEYEPPANPKPDDWVWSADVFTALTTKGNIETLKYTEWNNFVDRVKEFLEYKNKSTATIDGAKLSATNKILTAEKFEIVRTNIEKMSDTYVSEQQAGDPVKGEYFIYLQEALNRI